MKPITREEMYLAAAAGYDVAPPEPITRKEVFLAKLAGMEVETPVPFTRRERFIEEAAVNGGGGSVTINNQDITVTENGQYTADEGYTGLGTVTVDVPDIPPVLQEKSTIQNGTVTPDSGYDGLSKVTVNVPDVPAVVTPLNVTENGTYTAPEGVDGYNPVTVAVPAPEIKLQDKTITENGEYTADSGFDGLGKVLVQLASSGGANIKVACGTLTEEYSDYSVTINHNLGVVPDFAWVFSGKVESNYAYLLFGISDKLDALLGEDYSVLNCRVYNPSSSRFYVQGVFNSPINTSGGRNIYNANETSMTVAAGPSSKLPVGTTWIVIGGLVPDTE